jgi:hypothetical protein
MKTVLWVYERAVVDKRPRQNVDMAGGIEPMKPKLTIAVKRGLHIIANWPELCPVVWSVPGGWLLVMRRAEPLSDEEFDSLDFLRFARTADYAVPVEDKIDSFGRFAGRIVAVDYGS